MVYVKKIISLLLILATFLLICPPRALAVNTWEIRNRSTASDSNIDEIYYKGMQRFSQDVATGEFGGIDDVSSWMINDTNYNPKLYLAVKNDGAEAKEVLNVCFSYEQIKDNLPGLPVDAIPPSTTLVVSKVFLLWQVFGAKGEQYDMRCFKSLGESGVRALLSQIGVSAGHNTELAINIWRDLNQGNTSIVFHRDAINSNTITQCKDFHVKPQFQSASDREKAGNAMKQAITTRITEMANQQGKGEMVPEILKALEDTMNHAVNELKSDRFGNLDQEMYRKFYSRSSDQYPDVRLTQNLYMEVLKIQDDLNTAMTAATTTLSDTQQKISTGLNITAGVAILALGVATVVAVPAIATAYGGATSMAIATATAAGPTAILAAEWAVTGLVGTLAAGLGLSLVGMGAADVFSNLGEAFDGDGNHPTLDAIKSLYNNHFDDLFKMYMANAYVTANNNYNTCALKQGDEWAVVNDTIAENLKSLMNQAYDDWAAASLSAFGTVCDTISGHGTIGDALYKAFCSLGLALQSWADSFLNMTFCYLQTSLGYVNSKTSTWSSCKSYTNPGGGTSTTSTSTTGSNTSSSTSSGNDTRSGSGSTGVSGGVH